MKVCPRCTRHLRVVVPSSDKPAFNSKSGPSDGLQPWCRTCDWHGKGTLEEAWNSLVRFLRDKEPQHVHLWTFDEYAKTVGEHPTCTYCGSLCREWGRGHWLDRQSSTYGHIPSNCVPCCAPCNFHKGHKTPAVYEATTLRGLLAPPHGYGLHPRGKIPWDTYESSSKRFVRVSAPDLSAHVVDDMQLDFFTLPLKGKKTA